MSVHIIGKIDAFAARDTDLYLDTETGECYYFVFGAKIGIMDDTGKVARLVDKFYKKHPAPAESEGSADGNR